MNKKDWDTGITNPKTILEVLTPKELEVLLNTHREINDKAKGGKDALDAYILGMSKEQRDVLAKVRDRAQALGQATSRTLRAFTAYNL